MSVITRDGKGCEVDQRERRAPGAGPPGGGPPRGGGGQRIRPPRGPSPTLDKRVALLPTRDRAIVELTLRSHLSRAGIARALGTTPGQVSRRLRVLYARLHDPLVIALCDERCPLAPEYRQLGIEHHLLGTPVPQLADQHRLPSGEVRRMLVFLRGWQKGITGRWARHPKTRIPTIQTNTHDPEQKTSNRLRGDEPRGSTLEFFSFEFFFAIDACSERSI